LILRTTSLCQRHYDCVLHIEKLHYEVGKLIYANKFINDCTFKMLTFKLFNVNISQYAIRAWKHKYNISTIKPSYSRVAKKTPFNEWYDREFLRKASDVLSKYDHDCIMNGDETHCKTFPSSVNKVYGFTNSGRQGRIVEINNVDVKEGITCMLTITYAGNVLPAMFVKKGKTTQCMKNINTYIPSNATVTHSESGWMTETTCIYYIENIVVPYLNHRPGCLIWDIYRPHFSDTVKQSMKNNNIQPLYVPASMTWKRQPLDSHIFGLLKKQYQAQYFERYQNNETVTQKQTIQIYCTLFTQLAASNAPLVKKSFDEAIFNERNSIPSSENDPRPVNLNAKEKSIVDDADDENDNDDEQQEQEEAEVMDEQFADKFSDEESDEENEEIAAEVPSYRRPRNAQNVAYNQQAAQNYQYNMSRT
jgi:hypothetical protein